MAERFAVDHARADQVEVPKCADATGKKIAIIGAGPSGLTAAYFLQLMGHQTVVFEEKEQPGGMLRYGIPSYRFPRDVYRKILMQFYLPVWIYDVIPKSVKISLMMN